jgi:hypothetical protein
LDDRHVWPCPDFSIEMGSHKHLYQDWPGTTVLLISASQVARIPDLSYQHLVSPTSWFQKFWPFSESILKNEQIEIITSTFISGGWTLRDLFAASHPSCKSKVSPPYWNAHCHLRKWQENCIFDNSELLQSKVKTCFLFLNIVQWKLINIHKALERRLSFGIKAIMLVTGLQRLNCPCSSGALEINCIGYESHHSWASLCSWNWDVVIRSTEVRGNALKFRVWGGAFACTSWR